jgi:hypothetical protein
MGKRRGDGKGEEGGSERREPENEVGGIVTIRHG